MSHSLPKKSCKPFFHSHPTQILNTFFPLLYLLIVFLGSGKKTIISIPPTITKAKRLNNTSAVVQWKPPTAMLRYIQRFKIYYTPASNNSKAAKAFTETLAKRTRKHKSSSLVPGVRYKVQVALVTSDGEGPRSVPSWIQSTEQRMSVAERWANFI